MILDLYALLKEELKPALGCTEPAAVALACAVAARNLHDQPVSKVTVVTDPNVYKNGMGVYIPGTGQTGLLMAAALGALSGQPDLELQVLNGCSTHVQQARELIDAGKVCVEHGEALGYMYINARVDSAEGYAEATIQGSHTHLTKVTVNGETLWQAEVTETPVAAKTSSLASQLPQYKLSELIAGCKQLPQPAYEFILASARTNQRVAMAGRAQKLGMGLGWHYDKLMQNGRLGNDLANLAMVNTAAAADARMSGWDEPVISTNGSGNQGITASLPVLTVGEAMHQTELEIGIALAISQIVTIYVKQHIGKLSALCACAVAAAVGASCGVSYLLGSSEEAMEQSVKLMVANLTGMICDGAKVSCAIKLATAASTAVQAALLANAGLIAPPTDGIIADTVEETIRNLGKVSNPGMVETDRVILDVMTHKG